MFQLLFFSSSASTYADVLPPTISRVCPIVLLEKAQMQAQYRNLRDLLETQAIRAEEEKIKQKRVKLSLIS